MSLDKNHPLHPFQIMQPRYDSLEGDRLFRPSIAPAIVSRSHAFKMWPGLGEAVKKLHAICEVEAPDCHVSSMLIRNSQLNSTIFNLSGSALLVCLPAGFEPYLAQLAAQRPFGMNQAATVDLLEAEQIYYWAIVDTAKEIWSLRFNIAVLDALVDDCRHSYGSMSFAPVIWLAGQTVAAGGFWIDENWGCDMALLPSSDHISRYCSEQELAEASERAKVVGQRPWDQVFWKNENGVYVIAPYVADYRSKLAQYPECD